MSSESERTYDGHTVNEGMQASKTRLVNTVVGRKQKARKKNVAIDSEESDSDDTEAPPLTDIDCDVTLNSGRGSKLESLNLDLSWRDVNSLWRTWAEIGDPMHRPRWGYKYASSAASKKPFVLGDDEAKWRKIVAEIIQNYKDVHAKVKGVKSHLPLVITDLNKPVSNPHYRFYTS
jgi:hypothetical protein